MHASMLPCLHASGAASAAASAVSLEHEFWCWCQRSVVPSDNQTDETVWHLEAPPLCWVQHGYAPNVAGVCVAVLYAYDYVVRGGGGRLPSHFVLPW